ncbi:hypothetical protein AB0K00_11555 [Dactylosporangium sp. NPDC049525]|uniref:hypothetical protein n=1 Tax=Dactylosporangium sp. NPDC049525 TaxID=3154730 RepID=UPI0034382BB5
MGATALRLLTVLVLLGGAAGCEKESGGSAAAATPNTTTADAKAVCAPVDDELKTTLAKVAEAEAIGPPAGHHAVSAQWSAGAATISSLITGVTGPVAEAANAVAGAMGAIADKYVDAKSKPDKAPVNAAIEAFRAVCR